MHFLAVFSSKIPNMCMRVCELDSVWRCEWFIQRAASALQSK